MQRTLTKVAAFSIWLRTTDGADGFGNESHEIDEKPLRCIVDARKNLISKNFAHWNPLEHQRVDLARYVDAIGLPGT